MKVVRIFSSILAISLFCVGMGMYSLHNSLKGIMDDQVVDFVLDGLVDTAFTMTITDIASVDGMDSLPEEVQQQIKTAKSEIVNDEALQAIVKVNLDAIMNRDVEEKVEIPNIKTDIDTIMQSTFPKIAQAIGIEISPEELDALSTQLLQEVDLETIVNEGIQSIQDNMNSEQKSILTGFQFVQSSKCMLLSIGLMIIAIITLGLLKKNKYTWLRPIGIASIVEGCILWGVSKGIASMVDQNLLASDALSQLINGSIGQFSKTGMQFIILGIVFIVAFFIIKRRESQVDIT